MNSELMYATMLLIANVSGLSAILAVFYLIDRLSPKKTNRVGI